MKPAKMRYKGRTFDHNPETVKVRDKAFVKEDNILFDEPLSRRTGRRCRVVSGRGQFIGDNCLNQYAELLRLYCEGGSGILSLPDIKPFFAYFTGLELSCDPSPDYSVQLRVYRGLPGELAAYRVLPHLRSGRKPLERLIRLRR